MANCMTASPSGGQQEKRNDGHAGPKLKSSGCEESVESSATENSSVKSSTHALLFKSVEGETNESEIPVEYVGYVGNGGNVETGSSDLEGELLYVVEIEVISETDQVPKDIDHLWSSVEILENIADTGLRLQWRASPNGADVILINDGLCSRKANPLPMSEEDILETEPEDSRSNTPKVLNRSQDVAVPSASSSALSLPMLPAKSKVNCVPADRKRIPKKQTPSKNTSKLERGSDRANSSQNQKSKSKSYTCFICSQHFSMMRELKTHQRDVHGSKSAKCSICDKEFFRMCDLNTHLKIHTGEKSFKCDICGKCFIGSFSLKIHNRTHTGEKPYECTFCGKSYATKSRLNRHNMSIHAVGDKPWAHTGEKSFKCDKCDFSTNVSSSLYGHKIFRHSDKRNFKCPDCPKAFKSRQIVKRHYKSAHDKQFNDECILE